MKPAAVASSDREAGPGPAGSERAVIETHGLCKRYGKKPALADLDLNVDAGEVFGFIGPNGAGKTTTIRLLLDLIRPSSGSVKVPRPRSSAPGHRAAPPNRLPAGRAGPL